MVQPKPDGFLSGAIRGQEELLGNFEKPLISSERPYPGLHHPHMLVTSHISLQHLKPTWNTFIPIPHAYQYPHRLMYGL